MAASGTAASATAPAPGATSCKNVAVPVTAAGQPAAIAGTLCVPPGATTVQLLIHGWTYARFYWDLPYRPGTYSYVRAANKRGYATLDIDRLGDGRSTHPLSAFDNFYTDISTVHQVITALRAGTLGTRFRKVIEVGHSLGGVVTLAEAGVYRDVDAIIPTGIAHSYNAANVAMTIADDYPAALDPKFAASGLDPAYLTSDPGTRNVLYLNRPSSTDPAVVAMDERLKQTGNIVDLATAADYPLKNTDRTLSVPVLDVVGQEDPIVCGLGSVSCGSSRALAGFERPFYGPDATVLADAVPDTGHDLQLELSAPRTTATMLGFADRYVGAGRGQRNTAPGTAAPAPAPPNPAPGLAAQATNAAIMKAVVPAIALLRRGSDTVPGVGTNADPVPGMAQALATIANLTDSLAGTRPDRALGGA